MDENKSPEDILDEILNRPPDKPPSPNSYPLKFDPPSDDDIPLSPLGTAKKQSGPDRAARLLPWLCVILAISLLVIGICVLQVVGANHSLDELRAENEALQNELQAALDAQQAAEQALKTHQEYVGDLSHDLYITSIQAWRSDYLFYIGQFMDNGDYPMAAMVAGLTAEIYLSETSLYLDPDAPVSFNPAQTVQYQEYRQELIDRGYLYEPVGLEEGVTLYVGFGGIRFADGWHPHDSPEMASLGILWAALNEYYVLKVPDAAAQFLVRYQNHTLGNYLQYLDSAATDYTIGLYEQLVSDMIEGGYLVEENGVFDYGPQPEFRPDILYHLPFELPQLP